MLRVPGHQRPDEVIHDPFRHSAGNSQMNLVNFTASLKEAVAQIRDLGDDFSEDDVWILAWHKPLMRHILNSMSHHYPVQVTRTKQMARDASLWQKPKRGAVNPGNKFRREFYALCVWDSALLHTYKRCSSYRPSSKFLRRFRSCTFCLSYALQ